MPTDLKLQDGTYDVDFDGADLLLVTDGDEVGQRAKLCLSTNRGEYLYDKTLGIPWTDVMLGASASYELRRGLVYNRLSSLPEIRSVNRLVLTTNSEQRVGIIEFSATSIYGETVEGGVSL